MPIVCITYAICAYKLGRAIHNHLRITFLYALQYIVGVAAGTIIHFLFAIHEHWHYLDKKMVRRVCECCCKRPGFTLKQYLARVTFAYLISFAAFGVLGLNLRTQVVEYTFWLSALVCVFSFLWLLRPITLMFGCIISKYSIVSIYMGIIIPITYDTVVFSGLYTTGFIALSFFPLIIGGFAICILLLLSSFKDFEKFAMITFAILLQFLDVTTDIGLIMEWIRNENNIFWASMQAIIIIIISQIVASMKMGNFDNIEQLDNYTLTMKNSISKFDRFMTLIGLGRAWIGCKCIANYKLYYEEYSNLKIYEISLESIPTIILQIYVGLVSAYVDDEGEKSTISLEASIGITFILLSFSIWRIFARNSPNHTFSSKSQSGENVVSDSFSPSIPSVCTTTKHQVQSSIELQFECKEDPTGVAIENTLPKQVELETKTDDEQHSTLANNHDNNANVDNDSQLTLFYSKFDQFMIFLLIFCDFYIRSFSLIFQLFMIRYVEKRLIYLKIIICILTIAFLTLIGKFEYKMVLWMKQSRANGSEFNFRQEYTKRKLLRYQDVFLLYFSCLIEVVFTFPLKRIYNKNIFDRYG